MKKSTFIEQYALTEKNIATLERLETVKKSVKSVKNIDIKFDYETINDECDTKSARYDYMHVMYKNHNVIECYAKSNNILYCIIRTSVLSYDRLAYNFKVEKKSDKLTRVIIEDDKFYMIYSEICKAFE